MKTIPMTIRTYLLFFIFIIKTSYVVLCNESKKYDSPRL